MKPDANESEITRFMCAELRQAGAVCYAIVGDAMQTSGLPDRFVCHRRFCGFVEAKKNKNPLSGPQRARFEELRARGGCALVARYSWSDKARCWRARFRAHDETVIGPFVSLKKGCGTALVDALELTWRDVSAASGPRS